MIVYGSSLSPFVRKVLVICAEKGIEVENQVFGPGVTPTPEFLAASPFGKIPAIKDGDVLLADSTAIALYLEAKHPEPQLIPTGAEARGRTIWFDEFADTIAFPPKGKVFFNRVVMPLMGRSGDEEAACKAESEELPAVFAYLERTVPAAGGHLVDDRFTLADIAVASPFVNLRHARSGPDAATYPRLTAYLEHIHAQPSFAALIGKDEAFLERARARAAG